MRKKNTTSLLFGAHGCEGEIRGAGAASCMRLGARRRQRRSRRRRQQWLSARAGVGWEAPRTLAPVDGRLSMACPFSRHNSGAQIIHRPTSVDAEQPLNATALNLRHLSEAIGILTSPSVSTINQKTQIVFFILALLMIICFNAP